MRLRLLLGAVVLATGLGSSVRAYGAIRLNQIGGFNQPTFVTAPPGDEHRLLVVEQPGTVRLIKDGVLASKPFLKVAHVRYNGEQGLLSMAFDPDYASNRRLYVNYVRDDQCTSKNCDIEIDEFQRSSANPDKASPTTRRRVIRIAHRKNANHNGGQLQFGPDGFLYAGTGDGGGSGDPSGNAQDVDVLLGKLLRIDPHSTGGKPYTVPSGNPFVDGPGADEVWAYGLRNPWRFSFDHATGDLVIADVGQNKREEIDFQPRGQGSEANYGWNVCEGDLAYPTDSPCTSPPAGYVAPKLVYDHSGGACAITGGYVSRDHSTPETLGKYLYGDLCSGQLRAVTLPDASDDSSLGETVQSPSSFGEDAQCRVYVVSHDGPVYRIESDDPQAAGCAS
jgi:glucose/arabinose dehydrogenase